MTGTAAVWPGGLGGLPAALTWPMAAALAAVLGSFLNVCISRLPRGESVVLPASHCPRCQAEIRCYDNVPLLSFALLGGRCRACRAPISWRYPMVEALTITVGLLILWRLGPTWTGLSAFLLGLSLITVTFTDLECLLIPDRVTVPGILVGLATRAYPEPWSVVGGVVGCLLAGSIFYVIALASRGGMGGGDVKLAAMIGAFLGWQLVLVAIFVSVLAGGLVGLALLGIGLKGRKDPIPFGPFLALGGLITAVWGRGLLDWYLG